MPRFRSMPKPEPFWHAVCSGWIVFASCFPTSLGASRANPRVQDSAFARSEQRGTADSADSISAFHQWHHRSLENQSRGFVSPLHFLRQLPRDAKFQQTAFGNHTAGGKSAASDFESNRNPDNNADRHSDPQLRGIRNPSQAVDGSAGSSTSDGDFSRLVQGPCGSRLNLLLSYAGWRSDPWVERLPRLLEPMGITSHTAFSGREAGKLISQTRIHVAVVDLGLPLDETQRDGDVSEFTEGGSRLLELLARLPEPPPVVAVKRSRTHRDDSRELAAALRHGAFAVVDRPHDQGGVNLMLEVLRRCLERHYRGCWPTDVTPVPAPADPHSRGKPGRADNRHTGASGESETNSLRHQASDDSPRSSQAGDEQRDSPANNN